MRSLVSLLVGVAVVTALLSAQATPAYACSIAPSFVVTADHLATGDFNEPNSQLANDYREWAGDDTASIEVLGVYVYETIAAVEPEGDYSRGSVSVAMEMWGQWPADALPDAIAAEERKGEPPSTCGWGPSGRPLGTRSYSIISTADFAEISISDDARDVLTAAFGAPAIADRDVNLEQELIAQIQRSNRSFTPFVVGIGVAAIAAAGAVMYAAQRTRSAATPEFD